MLPKSGQTAGTIGLNFFVDTHGWPGSVIGYIKFDFFFSLATPGPSASSTQFLNKFDFLMHPKPGRKF